jgi:hypothetical protein
VNFYGIHISNYYQISIWRRLIYKCHWNSIQEAHRGTTVISARNFSSWRFSIKNKMAAPRSHLQLFLESKLVQDPIKNLKRALTKNPIHALRPFL